MRIRAREAAAEAILDAAEKVAAARGLEATSTAAIAETAGVAVGTLYNYFPDREALLAALFASRREALHPRMVAADEASAALPFDDRLRSYLTHVMAAFEDYRAFCRIAIAAEGSIRPGGPPSTLVAITATFTALLRPIVGDAAEEHATAMSGALKALVRWRIERDLPLAPIVDLVANAFLHGMPAR
jgi:AcrR family transcriptional regulator